jgi:glycosyltransferase involved in cell wall biosynthesis
MFPNESGDITIFGKQSNEKKLELMSRAHVILVPGVREGWGLVVSEANAMGTPAVAYDVPGLRDSVVDRVTGLLVGRDDYAEMADEVIGLLKDHIKRKTYAKNAMQNAKQYEWNVTASHVHKLITEVEASSSKAFGSLLSGRIPQA